MPGLLPDDRKPQPKKKQISSPIDRYPTAGKGKKRAPVRRRVRKNKKR